MADKTKLTDIMHLPAVKRKQKKVRINKKLLAAISHGNHVMSMGGFILTTPILWIYWPAYFYCFALMSVLGPVYGLYVYYNGPHSEYNYMKCSSSIVAIIGLAVTFIMPAWAVFMAVSIFMSLMN